MVVSGSTDLDAASISAWKRWALAEADRIDPVKSGQIGTHLEEPGLDQVG